MAKRKMDDVVLDIRRAAYLFGTNQNTLQELSVMFKVSRRTLSRWRKTQVWNEQIDLLSKEG